MQVFFKDVSSTTQMVVEIAPWDFYLAYRFAEEGIIQAKAKIKIGGIREMYIDILEFDIKRTFTPETLDRFEDEYAERGIMVW